MQKLLPQQDDLKTFARRQAAAVQHAPEGAEVMSAATGEARTSVEAKQFKQAKYQEAQVWGQVSQAVVALITAIFYVFHVQSLPSTMGAMGGVAFVTHLIYRCLVLQHYFRTGKMIRGGRIGSPLRFYLIPALGFALLAAMQIPIITDWSGYEADTHWRVGIMTVTCLAGALFFAALAVITLKRRRRDAR